MALKMVMKVTTSSLSQGQREPQLLGLLLLRKLYSGQITMAVTYITAAKTL